MSLGRMGADRNLSSAAAAELFTAQPDGLVQQQPFRINNCCSGGRGSFRNCFAFQQEYFFFFFLVLSGHFALGEMSGILKEGFKKKGKYSVTLCTFFFSPTLPLCCLPSAFGF